MEIEIVSKEFIKPSSPTPLHLKTHKLSLLDQYMPPSYTPMALYYPIINHDQYANLSLSDIVLTRFQILKQSLSEVLTFLYPFAGTIKDKLSIDCNDEGVCFVEARTKNGITLSEFLTQPDVSLINKFHPTETKWSQEPIPGAHVASVQATSFDCGGIVIGISFYHMMADGTSMSTFLKSWAATARRSSPKVSPTTEVSYTINPNFDSSFIFPLNDEYPEEATLTTMVKPFFKDKKWVTERFVFDASCIAKLKSKATSSRIKNPTLVEAVSGIISKCIHAAVNVNSSSYKSILMTQAVNLRRRSVPPLPEQSIGNFIWVVATPISQDDKEEAGLQELVYQLRGNIRKIDGNFVSGLKGNEGLNNFVEAVKDVSKSSSAADDFLGISSWCNFGFYEVDFGWGKPTWASCIGLMQNTPFVNTIILMDTRSGDGVEAWVYLGEKDMSALLLNEEFRAFASLNPSPLGRGF